VESRDQQGNPLRLVGTMIDVTPQKSLEKLMYINQFAINHASDAITLLNHEAKFIYVNQAACESLEYSRDQLLNMSIFDIDPIVTREYWKEHWLKLTERKSLSVETLHRTQSGKIFPVEISCNYFKINNQEFDFTFVKDITERKQAEYKINKAYQELEIGRAHV
jgi:PAS domain S-box-containing protein